MKKRYIRVSAILLCICMLTATVFSLSACKEDDPTLDEGWGALPEAQYEPYDYSNDDSKFALSLSGIASFVTGKIVDKAKSTALGYVENVGNTIWTKATDWLKNSLLYCLGIEPEPVVPQHTINEVYDQVTAIQSDITQLKDDVEKLQQETTTGQYVTKYTAFMNVYNDIVETIKVPSAVLEKINAMRASEYEDQAQLESDYNAAAKSLEGNIRGSGTAATPVNQQTQLSASALRLGTSMMGNSGITNVDKDGIFSVIRYFAEQQSPWQHQRKTIEDNYLATLIYTYQMAHSLVLFDLTYQMQQYDIGGIYTAPDDGTVLAFQYPAENGQWYINAYPYAETFFRTQYADVFDAFEEDGQPVTVNSLTSDMTGEDGDYADLSFLFGYYSQHVKQYNQILLMFNNYTREDLGDVLVLQTANNGDGTYQEKKFPKTLTGMEAQDFISFRNDHEFYINFDKFKNCTKSEFMTFIGYIKPYAGDKSLYEYLSYVGFEIPRATFGRHKNYIPLAIEKLSDEKRKDNHQVISRFNLYSIDIDLKVKDIGNNSFFKSYWHTTASWHGACNNKKSYSEHIGYEYTAQSHVSVYTRDPYSCNLSRYGGGGYNAPGDWPPIIPYFISLPGLSDHSLSGTIMRGNVNAGW